MEEIFTVEDNSLIICENYLKRQLLSELAKRRQLNNLTFITPKDLIKKMYFDYDIKAKVLLKQDLKLTSYEVKTYLDNLAYYFLLDKTKLKSYEGIKYTKLEKVYNYLKINNLLKDNRSYLDYLHKKKAYYFSYNKESKDQRKLLFDFQYQFIKLANDTNNEIVVNECIDLENELFYMFEDLSYSYQNNKVSLNDVYIALDQQNIDKLKFYANLYGFKLALNDEYLFEYNFVKDCIGRLVNNEAINNNISLENKEIYNQFLDVYNKYASYSIQEILDFLIDDLKKTRVKKPSYNNTISVKNIEELLPLKNKKIYILDLNLTVIPKIIKNDGFFLDDCLARNHLDTTKDINDRAKENLSSVLSSDNNLFLAYKLRSKELNLEKSEVIAKNKVHKCSDQIISKYANNYNKLLFTRYIDNFNKYNINSQELSVLSNTYQNSYNSYDNSFKPFKIKRSDNRIDFSYTSLAKYMDCSFNYYIDKILKINAFSDNFYTCIGSIYHGVLEAFYNDNSINLDETFDKCFIKEIAKIPYNDSEFFLIKEQINNIKKVIQNCLNQDKNHNYDNKILETELSCLIPFNYHDKDYVINLKGKIDKIYYKIINQKTYLALIDYKTGNYNLTNFTKALDSSNLQLPIYAYLVSNCQKFDNPVITCMGLHTILNKDEEKQKKLLAFINTDYLDKEVVFDKSIIDGHDSELIYGLKYTKSGSFNKNSKLFNDKQLSEVFQSLEKYLIEAAKSIIDNNYDIIPQINEMNSNDSITKLKKRSLFNDISYLKDIDIVLRKFGMEK